MWICCIQDASTLHFHIEAVLLSIVHTMNFFPCLSSLMLAYLVLLGLHTLHVPKVSLILLESVWSVEVVTHNYEISDCASQQCGSIVFQLGVLILELITGQSSGEEGGVDLIKWVQESSFQDTIHNMIDPDLGNNYDSKELKGLLAVARLCVKSSDKPTVFISQIFWYLQKKLGITDELNWWICFVYNSV